jgi:hypothetical protein
MKPIFAGLCLLMSFSLVLPWACSKKQPDAEISLGTPVPTGTTTVAGAPVSGTPVLQFEIPSPTPSTAPLEYEVEDLQGTAMALLDGATDAVTVEEGETLETGDTLITLGHSQTTLSLNDVTAVHVSEATTVKIADLEANSTQGFISRLELVGGQVLSEVEKLDASHSTFEVNAGGVVCGVRGTAFEVQNQGGQVETNTFHGAVEVDKDDQSQLVKGGEHSAFSFKKSGFLAKRKLNLSENNRYKLWGRVYKRAQQKRAERMKLIRKHPHSPQARRLLQRREALRQRRLQFQVNHSNQSSPALSQNPVHSQPARAEKRQSLRRERPLLNRRHLENHANGRLNNFQKKQALRREVHPGAQNRPQNQKPRNFRPNQQVPRNGVSNNRKKFSRDLPRKRQTPKP